MISPQTQEFLQEWEARHRQPSVPTQPSTALTETIPTIQPSPKRDIFDTFNSIKNYINDEIKKINRKYITPLWRDIKSGAPETRDVLSQSFKEIKEKPLGFITDVLTLSEKGFEKGALMGHKLPFVEDYEYTPYTSMGKSSMKEAEGVAEFIGWFVPYETTAKLTTSAFTKYFPKFVLNHPKLTKHFIDYASFVGVTELEKDALTLTPEEQEKGVTIPQKIALNALGSVSFLTLLKGGGFLLKKAKDLGIDVFNKAKEEVQNNFRKEALKAIEKEVAEGVTEKNVTKVENLLKVAKEEFTPMEDLSADNFIKEVKEHGAFDGKRIISKMGIEETRSMLEENNKMNVIDPIIYDGGYRFFNQAPSKMKPKVDEPFALSDVLLNFRKEGVDKEILNSVYKRYSTLAEEFRKHTEAGGKLSDFRREMPLTEKEVNFLTDVFNRFAKSNGTIEDFISALTNKDYKSLSWTAKSRAALEANNIARYYNYSGYEEMYQGLIYSNPKFLSKIRPAAAIGVAPYVGKTNASVAEALPEFDDPEFLDFKDSIVGLMKVFKLKKFDFQVNNALGGWLDTDLGKAIFEVSARIESRKPLDEKTIDIIAATLGKMKNQQGVYRIIYDVNGPDVEYSLMVSRKYLEEVANVITNSPFKDGFTMDLKNAIIYIGDLKGEKINEFNLLKDELRKREIGFRELPVAKGRIRFIQNSEYDSIIGRTPAESWLKNWEKRRVRNTLSATQEIAPESEKIIQQISSAENAVEAFKEKDVFAYVKSSILNNPNYSYENLLKDVAAKALGVSEEEFEYLRNNFPAKFNTEIRGKIDNLFRKRFKKDSITMFTQWVGEFDDNLARMDGEGIRRALGLEDYYKTDTPRSDFVLIKNNAEANVNLAQDLQKGFLSIASKEDTPLIANEKLEKLFEQRTSFFKSIKEKMNNSLKETVQWMRRMGGEFEVDPILNKYFPEFIEWEIRLRAKPAIAENWANEMVGGIIKDLSPDEYAVFNRLVVLSDFLVTGGRGLKLPENITPDVVLKELTTLFKKAHEQYPRAISSLRRHIEAVREIREDMKELGWIDEDWQLTDPEVKKASYSVLEDILKQLTGWSDVALEDFYFPHKVLDYLNFKLSGRTWIPPKMRKPFKPYLKERVGSVRDIETNYEDVMKNYFANVKLDVMIERATDDVLKKYDLFKMLSDDELKELSIRRLRTNSLIPDDKIPQRIKEKYPDIKWRVYQYDKGNYVFPALTINEKLMQEALAENATMEEWLAMVGPRGGTPTREMLVIGSKKPVYAIPDEIFKKINKLRTPMPETARKMLEPLIAYTRWFKPVVTKWLGGIPWRLVNTLGDFMNLAIYHPRAFSKVGEAANIAYEVIFKHPGDWDTAAKEWYKKLSEGAVLSSSFFGGDMSISLTKIATNPFAALSSYFDKGSVFLETLPKLSSILKNLDNFEKGKPLEFFGADEFIKNLADAGYTKEAIYAFGRGVTIDYAAMPDSFKKLFSDALAPFGFWFARNIQKLIKAARKAPIYISALYTLPMTAAFIWNNSPSNRDIEEGLPEWRKHSFHLILGKTKDNKVIVIGFETPLDVLAKFTGVDNLWIHLENILNKKETLQEAATRFAYEIISAPPKFINNRLLNPIIQVFEGLAANKDPFTGKTIVPERLKNTPKALELQAEYALSKIFAPLLPIMNTSNVIDIKENPEDFIWEVLKKPIDVRRIINYDEYSTPQLLANAYNETIDKLDARKRQWLYEFDDIVINHPEKIRQKLEELNTQDPPIMLEGLLSHIISVSFLKNVFIEAARKAKTEEQRNAYKDIVRILQLSQRIKTLPRGLQEQLLKIESQ